MSCPRPWKESVAEMEVQPISAKPEPNTPCAGRGFLSERENAVMTDLVMDVYITNRELNLACNPNLE